MFKPTSTLLVLLCSASLAACGGGDEGPAPNAAYQVHSELCRSVANLGGDGAGSVADHGLATREDGAVSVRQQGAQVVASRTVTLHNDFGGATNAAVTLSSTNGNVVACPIAGGGYGILVRLEARAPTEQLARDSLDTLIVRHDDVLAPDALSLTTRVETPDTAIFGNMPSVEFGAEIIAGLPSAPTYSLSPSTTNGNVAAIGFSGLRANLSTTNGDAGLDGRWDGATIDSSNGITHVAGDFALLDASSTNGLVSATLATSRDTQARIASTNGEVGVTLRRSGNPGFDLDASTTNGRAVIVVAGTEPTGEQSENHVHRQTPDYASRAVQVQVAASSTNGDVLIRE